MGRRILWGVAIVLVIVALAAVGIVVYDKASHWPTKQSEYADLSLGMPMNEVKYVKGYPTYVLEDPPPETAIDSPIWGYRILRETKDLKDGQHVEDYTAWEYEVPSQTRIDVEFDKAIRR
jgi:hypothetical protein